MAQYDNTNTFALFINDKGENPKRPDWSGTANLNGVEFRLSGWKRQSARGEFISGQIQTKEIKTTEYGKPAVEGAEEDIPF